MSETTPAETGLLGAPANPAAPKKQRGNPNIGNLRKQQVQQQQPTSQVPPQPAIPQAAFAATQTAPAPVKRKRLQDAPDKYIFRFVKPPDKKLWGNKAGRTYLKQNDTINWPFHVVDKDGVYSYVPVDIRDERTDLKAGEEEGTIIWQPRDIRFIFTEKSIFVDEQERTNPERYLMVNGRNPIIDNDRNRDALLFVKFELQVKGTMTTLRDFLWCTNQCKNQHPKVRRHGDTKPLFQLLDFGQIEDSKVTRGKLREKCYRLASDCRDAEMIPHAKYLNISFVVPETSQRRDIDAIREDYKDYAYQQPELFESSFNDPKVKIMHMITTAIERSELGLGLIKPGQAHWMRTARFITMLPGDKNPIEYLAEFTLTAEGAEFASQLKALNLVSF